MVVYAFLNPSNTQLTLFHNADTGVYKINSDGSLSSTNGTNPFIWALNIINIKPTGFTIISGGDAIYDFSKSYYNSTNHLSAMFSSNNDSVYVTNTTGDFSVYKFPVNTSGSCSYFPDNSNKDLLKANDIDLANMPSSFNLNYYSDGFGNFQYNFSS